MLVVTILTLQTVHLSQSQRPLLNNDKGILPQMELLDKIRNIIGKVGNVGNVGKVSKISKIDQGISLMGHPQIMANLPAEIIPHPAPPPISNYSMSPQSVTRQLKFSACTLAVW